MTIINVSTTRDGHVCLGSHVSALLTPDEARALAADLRIAADEAEKEVYVGVFIFADGSVSVDVYETEEDALNHNGDPANPHIALVKAPESTPGRWAHPHECPSHPQP